MNTRRAIPALLTLALVIATLGTTGRAAGAVFPAPAWKIVAATGPTNLPPTQSEVQKLTVQASGGTYTLSINVGEGKGTPVSQTGLLTLTTGSDVATAITGTYEAGERVAGSAAGSLAPETYVTAVNGSEVILSSQALASGSKSVRIFTTQIIVTSGTYHVGDSLSGTGIAVGTKVTAVQGSTLTTTKPTTAVYETGSQVNLTITESTGRLQFDGSTTELENALDGLPVLGAGAVSVTGGPGGEVSRPYFVEFDGPSVANQDVKPLSADGEALEGTEHFGSVFTTVPGGAGTGQIGIFPANVGGAEGGGIRGAVVVHLGPLPQGIVTTGVASGAGWSCVTAAQELTCESTSPVAAHHTTNRLGVEIKVEPNAVASGNVPVTISGGGGKMASYELPIVVSRADAAPGLAAFWAGSFEADGSPATQAGAHPDSSLTYLIVNTVRSPGGRVVPVASPKDVIASVPAGFLGDPLVTKRCPQSLIAGNQETGNHPNPNCESETVVGSLEAATKLGTDAGVEVFAELFNDVPPAGVAAEFSTLLVAPIQSLVGSVRAEEDFGIDIESPNSASTLEKLFRVFAALEGTPAAAHGKAFLTLPSDCAEEAREAPTVHAKFNVWEDSPSQYFFTDSPQPPVTGCANLEFTAYNHKTKQGQVQFQFQPTSTQGSSPVGAEAHMHIDQSALTDPSKLATPPLKRSVVKLPNGLTVNPSSANGLEACTEAQVGYKGVGGLPNPTRFNEEPVTCPDGSKLGTVEAISPLLEEPLHGTIYLASQGENPFNALIGLYLVIESPRFGLTLKLPGKVDPDPKTGQLTATFDYLPQAPVEELTLHFRGGGPRSELATPEVCGNYTTKGEWEPWSAPESGPPAQTENSFEVQEGCMESAAERFFEPTFEAGTTGTQAGAYSPLVIKVNRKDGEQELKTLNFTLPKGLIGKPAGIPYCSDAAIREAEGKSGRTELASPSCPAASKLGTVDAAAGVGSEPFHTTGSVYWAGPYEGAPFSAVVVTPAVAGPFDLGDVVVRAPLFVDPETALVTTKSDPLPTILKGIPLKVRSVTIYLNRQDFMLNPTNCEPMKISGSLAGSSGATANVSTRFQVGGCENLGFKPKLKISLRGATKRAGLPALKAVVTYPKKGAYANIARAQVNLPHSEFLEQNNLDKTCTRPVLLEGKCSKRSIYGKAKAWTPLLDKPLQGPVYLVGGYGYKLPALVAELNGQIRILLKGKVDSGHNKGIRNTFEAVPDAPVSRFVLEMKGGKRYGLLINSENLCRKKQRAVARFTAQNGLVDQYKPVIANQCGKRGKKSHKGGKKGSKNGKSGTSASGKVTAQTLAVMTPRW